MRFTPLTPERLIGDLARWITEPGCGRTRIGIDGPAEVGAGTLADAIGAELRTLGRPAIRASTSWWWRPASLRLELGRTDVGMLLRGWVDTGALRRELLDPLGTGGTGRYLTRLRDPQTDRSLRQARLSAGPGTVVLLDGPLLLADDLPLDAVMHVQVASSTLRRALPADRQWWIGAFERYQEQYRPTERAEVVIAYDHPRAPAAAWR